MGEYADMILDGLVDEETGELIDGDAPGYPRRMRKAREKQRTPVRPQCGMCGKRLKSKQGLRDHRRDAHGLNS